jgi:uncharacterized membrane protein
MIAVLSLCACGPKPAVQAPAPTGAEPPLHALGTEPFWSADLRDGQLSLTRPDHPAVVGPAKVIATGRDQAVWEARTADGRTLRLSMTAGECSDGMSDRRYPLKVEVELGAERLKGCGSRG